MRSKSSVTRQQTSQRTLEQRIAAIEAGLEEILAGCSGSRVIGPHRPGGPGDCSGCELGCMSGCTGSCTRGCTGFCESGCQTGCEGGCEMGCLGSCTSGCTGCESGCQTGCESGCEMGCQGCEGGCETTCEAAGDSGHGIDQGRCGSNDVMIPGRWWEWVSNPGILVVLAGSDRVVRAELEEGQVTLEQGLAFVAAGTQVSVRLQDNKVKKAKSVSTWILPVTRRVDGLVSAAQGKGKQALVGGALLSAQGQYKKGTGISIRKGASAKVLLRGTVYSGTLDDSITLGVAMLGNYSRRTGAASGAPARIRRVTRR